MNTPDDLKYTKSHEWIRIEGDKAFVGITDYAQDTLGDIVFIELPEVGTAVKMDEELTTIESVKAAEPIYAPLSGEIAGVNEILEDKPESINEDPYGTHLFVVKLADPSEVDSLLSAAEYEKAVEEEE